MGAKLSDGFAGETTRQFKGLLHEVEARMSRNDPFKEQFSGSGVFEGSLGQYFSKRKEPYQDQHTDFPSGFNHKQTPQFKMEADGNQEALDYLDEIEHKIQAPIKNPYDQFPGAYQDHVKKSDNGQLDPHQVDPTQLERKTMSDSVGPEEFHKEVEKRMKRLSPGSSDGKLVKIMHLPDYGVAKIYRDTSPSSKEPSYSFVIYRKYTPPMYQSRRGYVAGGFPRDETGFGYKSIEDVEDDIKDKVAKMSSKLDQKVEKGMKRLLFRNGVLVKTIKIPDYGVASIYKYTSLFGKKTLYSYQIDVQNTSSDPKADPLVRFGDGYKSIKEAEDDICGDHFWDRVH